MLIFFLGIMASVEGVSASAFLHIFNIPYSVEFYTNGLLQSPNDYGILTVVPGEVLLEITRERVVVFSSSFHLDSGETKSITFNCSEECALLHVVTEPPGAILSMNGTILGLTPYMNRFIKPGNYSIMVTAPGYFPVIRRIDLSVKSDIESYVMEQTKAARDSLSAVRKALERKQKKRKNTVIGLAGMGMSAAGAYYDWKAYSRLKRMDAAGIRYDRSVFEGERARQKNIYYHNRDDAQRQILYRNICYGIAGLCFTALSVAIFL